MHLSHSNNILVSVLLPWVNGGAAVYFGLLSLAQDIEIHKKDGNECLPRFPTKAANVNSPKVVI